MNSPHDVDIAKRQSPGLFDSIKNLAASLVSHLHTRLALFATELAEEKLRLSAILFAALLAVFLLFMAMIFISVFVVAVGWDTPYRLYIIGGLALGFLLGAAIAVAYVRARLKAGPPPFAMSLAELYKDKQALSSR